MAEFDDRANELHLRFVDAIIGHMRAHSPPDVEAGIVDEEIFAGVAILCAAFLATCDDEHVEGVLEGLVEQIRADIEIYRARNAGIDKTVLSVQ